MAQSAPASKHNPAKTATAAHAFFRDEFPLIRKAATLFGISLLLSAVLVGISQVILHKTREGMDREQALRNDARSKQHQAGVDKMEVVNYQPRYLQLQEQGFVGEEQRLDWMEGIRQIRESRKLFPVSYEFSPQQPYQIDPSVLQTGDLALRGSKMTFRLDLLHELDLLNFLDDLKSKGFYTVQSCTVKRLAPSDKPPSPQLTADCTLNWLTFGERTPAPAPPGSAPQ